MIGRLLSLVGPRSSSLAGLSGGAMRSLGAAAELARRSCAAACEPIHIVLGILEVRDRLTDQMLSESGADGVDLESRARRLLEERAPVSAAEDGVALSRDSRDVLAEGRALAARSGCEIVHAEHLLIAALEKTGIGGLEPFLTRFRETTSALRERGLLRQLETRRPAISVAVGAELHWPWS